MWVCSFCMVIGREHWRLQALMSRRHRGDPAEYVLTCRIFRQSTNYIRCVSSSRTHLMWSHGMAVWYLEEAMPHARMMPLITNTLNKLRHAARVYINIHTRYQRWNDRFSASSAQRRIDLILLKYYIVCCSITGIYVVPGVIRTSRS